MDIVEALDVRARFQSSLNLGKESNAMVLSRAGGFAELVGPMAAVEDKRDIGFD